MDKYEELYQWVETHPITRPKRNINRDFSDAIPLVEILKHHFPKLVEIHNYMPRNSFAQKLINWETLNNKVLKKLKLNLTNQRIEQLAKGVPGAIEELLIDIQKRIEKINNSAEEANSVNNTEPERNIEMKTIPLEVFEKMQNDINEKDETIAILQNEIEHLTNLLNNKEEYVRDLTNQIETLSTSSTKKADKLEDKTRFFGFF